MRCGPSAGRACTCVIIKARQQYGDDVTTGLFPWVANARAVMQNEQAGWVKSIHETRGGEMLGLVM
jgi:pyruvate/2-oxoglutarate dehydrogenase complex dihydrolipoamide dehydrogenase (E3) component